MTKEERNKAFVEKLKELATLTKELHSLATTYYEYDNNDLMKETFGRYGRIFEDIKDLCCHYRVDF